MTISRLGNETAKAIFLIIKKVLPEGITFQETVLCWLESLIQQPATKEVRGVEKQNAKVAQVEVKTGCHITLQFAAKPNPTIRKELASMFISVLEGHDTTQAKK